MNNKSIITKTIDNMAGVRMIVTKVGIDCINLLSENYHNAIMRIEYDNDSITLSDEIELHRKNSEYVTLHCLLNKLLSNKGIQTIKTKITQLDRHHEMTEMVYGMKAYLDNHEKGYVVYEVGDVTDDIVELSFNITKKEITTGNCLYLTPSEFVQFFRLYNTVAKCPNEIDILQLDIPKLGTETTYILFKGDCVYLCNKEYVNQSRYYSINPFSTLSRLLQRKNCQSYFFEIETDEQRNTINTFLRYYDKFITETDKSITFHFSENAIEINVESLDKKHIYGNRWLSQDDFYQLLKGFAYIDQ